MELSAIIQINASVAVKTFFDFAKLIYNHIMNLAREFQRCDIVCDRYLNDSIKEDIRKDRCVCSRKIFTHSTKFPSNFREDFLANGENKEDLNRYLADRFIEFHRDHNIDLVITKDDSIITNRDELIAEVRINTCTSEEADARLVRHAINCVENKFSRVVVRTVDTDVVILLIGNVPYMNELGHSKIHAMLGLGK